MLFTAPMSFAEAEAAAARRAPVGSVLTSAEWEQVPLAVRDRAFFSAQQTNLTFLTKAKESVQSLAAGSTDRATQRLELRKLAESLGLAPAGGDGSGGLTEIGSDARLNLVLDTNTRQVQGYGDFVQANDPDVLAAYPAWELIDTNPGQTTGRRADTPNSWPARWLAAGGPPFFGSRMIALKRHPVWARLSRFGTPYSPFDYGSYWETEDVDYDTAVEAGVLQRGEALQSAVPGLNDTLQASIPPAGSEYARLLQDLFPGLIDISDGAMRLKGRA